MTTRAKGSMSEPARSARKCPTCGKPTAEDYRPFCSKRCADIDLSRWLKGTYSIPTVEGDGETVPDTGEDEA